MTVFIEKNVFQEAFLANNSSFNRVKKSFLTRRRFSAFIMLKWLFEMKGRLMAYDEGSDDLTDKIDFAVCLGGDGTLLHASSLFQKEAPPVIAFHLVWFTFIIHNENKRNLFHLIKTFITFSGVDGLFGPIRFRELWEKLDASSGR